MHSCQPPSGGRSVFLHSGQIGFPSGVFDEEPVELFVTGLDRAEAPERRKGEPGQNVLINDTLGRAGGGWTSFGNDRRPVRSGAHEAENSGFLTSFQQLKLSRFGAVW